MNAIEILIQIAEDTEKVADMIHEGNIKLSGTDPARETNLVESYRWWVQCLYQAAWLLGTRIREQPEKHMGIGQERFIGLTSKNEERICLGDLLMLEGVPPLYFRVEFIQNEYYSKIVKASGNDCSDLGKDAASKLVRIGRGIDHPDLLKLTRGDTDEGIE